MTNHKEILRVKNLGLNKTGIASACDCGRNTVTRTLQRVADASLCQEDAKNLTLDAITEKLYPENPNRPAYRMPDNEQVYKEMQKDRTYVNVIMSDNMEAMKALRDFLAEHHITNVAADTYTRDWNTKTISITAYPETKAESRLIRDYIADSHLKFKVVVQPG